MADNSEDALAAFMSITGAESATALQYLELTNWSLDEAVNLFMESGASHSDYAPPPLSSDSGSLPPAAPTSVAGGYDMDDIRAPDPSKRQRLVGDAYLDVPIRRLHEQYRDFAAESIAAINAVASESAAIGTAFGAESNGAEESRGRDLTTLFQPPVDLMFQGTYSEARARAKEEGKWLLVNIQDEIVFASHMLNRDTWSDDTVQNVVASGYIFWQNYWVSEHGKKFCRLYQIEREMLPVIVIINPKSGEIVQRWTGFMEAETMTERLSDYSYMRYDDDENSTTRATTPGASDIMDASEDDQLAAAIAASLEGSMSGAADDDAEEKRDEPEPMEDLPEEPADGAADVTRVQIRAPDGTRLTRRFLKSDPAKYLWAFVRQQIPEARGRAFELRTAFPPALVPYCDAASIADRQLANASLMVKWVV